MRVLRQIAPGFYFDDARRELIANVPELLALAGWENTPAKFDEMADIVKDTAPMLMPDVPIIILRKLDIVERSLTNH